jgi:hypothetical protein
VQWNFGGDDKEHEITISILRNWVSLDIPLSSFTGLTTLTYCSNYICWSTIRATTVYVDNVFL